MQKIEFGCPFCSVKNRAVESAAGKIGKCANCGRRIRIPAPTAPAVTGGGDHQFAFPNLDQSLPAADSAAVPPNTPTMPVGHGAVPNSAERTFEISQVRRFSLTRRSGTRPATLTLTLEHLRVESPDLESPIELSRPPARRDLRFGLGGCPIQSPRAKSYFVRIARRTFCLDREAAKSLMLWYVPRPFVASAWAVYSLAAILVLQIVGTLIFAIAMASGTVACGIPLGPLIFGIQLYRTNGWKQEYDRLERLRRTADVFATT